MRVFMLALFWPFLSPRWSFIFAGVVVFVVDRASLGECHSTAVRGKVAQAPTVQIMMEFILFAPDEGRRFWFPVIGSVCGSRS